MLQSEGRGKTVIFVKTNRTASKLAEELIDRGFNATPLHGDMTQEGRERSMKQFREGKKDILVATEVAARGIDVDDVTHVINYSVPEDEKAYLHRVGRTGRAGRTGIAVTFVDWEDLQRWKHINTALEFGQEEPIETYSSSQHLFEDMKIPAGTKGRLKPATPKANTGEPGGHSKAGHQRNDRNKTRSGDKPHKPNTEHRVKDEHDKTTHADHEHRTPNSERNRQRRRTRGGQS
jgi:superfamily II DNA/RNA helicase